MPKRIIDRGIEYDFPLKDLIAELKKKRPNEKINQKSIAEKMGCTATWLARAANGKVKPENIEKIHILEEIFGKPFNQIFIRKDGSK